MESRKDFREQSGEIPDGIPEGISKAIPEAFPKKTSGEILEEIPSEAFKEGNREKTPGKKHPAQGFQNVHLEESQKKLPK